MRAWGRGDRVGRTMLKRLAYFVQALREKEGLDNDYDFPAPFPTVRDLLDAFDAMKESSGLSLGGVLRGVYMDQSKWCYMSIPCISTPSPGCTHRITPCTRCHAKHPVMIELAASQCHAGRQGNTWFGSLVMQAARTGTSHLCLTPECCTDHLCYVALSTEETHWQMLFSTDEAGLVVDGAAGGWRVIEQWMPALQGQEGEQEESGLGWSCPSSGRHLVRVTCCMSCTNAKATCGVMPLLQLAGVKADSPLAVS
jgi:hypothetical protein